MERMIFAVRGPYIFFSGQLHKVKWDRAELITSVLSHTTGERERETEIGTERERESER